MTRYTAFIVPSSTPADVPMEALPLKAWRFRAASDRAAETMALTYAAAHDCDVFVIVPLVGRAAAQLLATLIAEAELKSLH